MLCTAEDSLMFTRGKYVGVGVIECSATRWLLFLVSKQCNLYLEDEFMYFCSTMRSNTTTRVKTCCILFYIVMYRCRILCLCVSGMYPCDN